ncbi:hypothetical protein AV274_6471 [Blastocystis sp. ATCC 50177/Nand II]|uniref:Uncharacterized protein n=1 Tax=Blastocystis sp. subtype 1 (strain ATCC 50177 / NandII) TaxID=478820 RepID=A0A196S3Y4_BLAHN|nr:hypothetical protein AV274_6471 [Blastocystis sp. ATCC 50177/Nand II]
MSRRAISKRYHPYSRNGRSQKTRKCSSCKCVKPMSNYKPIILYGKKVIPKTCQQCRARRNEHYWAFETKTSQNALPAVAERQDCIVDEDYDSLPEEASSCGSIELPGMDNIAINNDYHIHADTSALSADHLLQSTIALPKMSFEAYAAPSQPVASTDSFETDSNPSSTLFDGLSLGYENPFSVDDVAWSGEEGVPMFFDSPSTMNEEGGFLYPASNREVSNPFMLY